jgi:hypothetical protein
MQGRDTVEINPVREETHETKGWKVDNIRDSPFVGRKELARNEAGERTLEDGFGRASQIQQLIVETGWGLRPIIEKRHSKHYLFDL